ncbi:MAG: NAD(P)H-dependent oxidoreductase [Gammaproteobacteria bacterium]|nr:NAD(P)H-dependent oxidoreductase [Gammaproteobacteria bacterium]
MRLNLAVIYGSVRESRQGIRAACFMIRKLEERGHEVTLIDPKKHALPFLDRMYKEYEPGTAPEAMEFVGSVLKNADAFVIVSAEYNHSEPPALKNLLDHYQSEYHYKPSGIVTYSAGPFGGVRALITLRAILAELGTPSIPSVFPISAIGSAFDEQGNAIDTAYDRRVGKFLDEFEWYAHALKRARDHEVCDNELPMQQEICRGEN